MSTNDWNKQTIEEFRKNHGKVGGTFEGAPLLLLRHVGARSGKVRVNPVMYLKDDNRYIVFASKGGSDSHPDWFHNLKANPNFQIEVGDEILDVRAEEIKGAERDKIYAKQSKLYSNFADYQKKTKRVIPVIALYPKKKMSG
jgi:deazaflavin-dependent oxidoreductase (nitroreductase family)